MEWAAVDEFITGHLLPHDPVLDAALAANAAAELPAIDVSPAQGKLLYLLAKAIGARRILEIGTLGGYSTIWLARALPDDGALVTLEIDPHHAEVARANLTRARLAERVTIHVGAALESLAALPRTPFDLVFVDADKENGVAYVRAALDGLTPAGSVIIVENVVREGGVLDTASDDPRIIGTRALFDYFAREPRVEATAIQTVGAKKWDGFLIARVIG
ncbi:MAG: methyltransferase [Proteobacteria bacterium SG_bin6]|nr:MAG: methyltransferase [Proteobacteria bacterium SG_bin6]